MKIIIFDKKTKKNEFINYGYGKIREIIKCEVIEELNGRYDVELIVKLNDSKQKYLQKWNILSVDGQLFRIVNRKDNDFDNSITIFAKHIFYDIKFGFVIDKRAENKDVTEAMKIALPEDFLEFSVDSNIIDKNTIYFVKNNGAENMFAIIDRWGKGEIQRDNFNISILENKGNDNGVTFTYKKIKAIEIFDDSEEIITRLYPTGKDGITLTEKFIIVPNWNDEKYPPFHITREVNFPEAENEGDLRNFAKKEAETIGLNRVNFKINVSDLNNTSLYKFIPQLSAVNVGDLVTIKHPKLDVRIKIKCIRKNHEKVNNKITLEFGQPLKTFFESVDNNNVKVEIPIDNLLDKLFYYTNGKDIRIYENEKPKLIAHIRYSVNQKSNIMMYFNLFSEVILPGTLYLEIYRDNELLELKPISKCDTGHKIISFTYPLLAVEPNQYHQIDIKARVDAGHIYLGKEQMQLMIKGQGLAGGGAEAPHAEIVDKYLLNQINNLEKIKSTESIKITKFKPKRILIDNGIELKEINKITKLNTIEGKILIDNIVE